MKMITHIVFSTGVVLFVSNLLLLDIWSSILLVTLAVLMQYIIDSLSHEEINTRSRRVVRRTPLFHSPLGALILPAVFTAMLTATLRLNIVIMFKYFVVLIVASYSHLLLDLPTGRGIYVMGRRIWKKEKLHFDNPTLNLLFTFLGILLIIFSLYQHYHLIHP